MVRKTYRFRCRKCGEEYSTHLKKPMLGLCKDCLFQQSNKPKRIKQKATRFYGEGEE